MKRKLIIDGNAVYEIDEECMVRQRITGEKENSGQYAKEEKESRYIHKAEEK